MLHHVVLAGPHHEACDRLSLLHLQDAMFRKAEMSLAWAVDEFVTNDVAMYALGDAVQSF